MKRTILVISKSEEVCLTLQSDLSNMKHNVRYSTNIQDSLDYFSIIECFLVIVDRHILGSHPAEIMNFIHEKPVFSMILSAQPSSAQCRAEAYRLGADYYLPFPYEVEELQAMIASIIPKYIASKVLNTDHYCVPDYSLKGIVCGNNVQINPLRRDVIINGRFVSLPRKEFDLLYYLAVNQGRVITKDEIAENVWHRIDIDDNSIMLHIAHIRKKIEPVPSRPSFLRTVKGVGYKFIPTARTA